MDYPTGDKCPSPPWATWIPDRLPQWKLHKSLRAAKAAVGATVGRPVNRNGVFEYDALRGGVVYQVVGSTWMVRAVIEPGTFKDEHMLFTAPRKWNKDPTVTTVITENPYAA